MVRAGAAVDAVLRRLGPLLDRGDVVLDGGNSSFRDTDHRIAALASRGITFVGMGVSGGAEGALRGPSLMPGGTRSSYRMLAPLLRRIAAVADTEPCVAYCGRGSAGHFVKMVHNGVEYADMELLAEAYDLLRHGLGLRPEAIGDILDGWQTGELRSYLLDITARIVRQPDDLRPHGMLLERIHDAAGRGGSGRWVTQAALDLGIPVPTITAAVDTRLLSSMPELRAAVARRHRPAPRATTRDPPRLVRQLEHAVLAAKLCAYAQGFQLLAAAARDHGYGTDLAEVARIWRAGCIIRAPFLDRVRAALARPDRPPHLLLDPTLARTIARAVPAWRAVVGRGAAQGIALPALSASLAYFDGLRRARLPTSVVQAQRDLFGAHGYRRCDRPGTFHGAWTRDDGTRHAG
jgi:6-phosphogluconate dehydrogenase